MVFSIPEELIIASERGVCRLLHLVLRPFTTTMIASEPLQCPAHTLSALTQPARLACGSLPVNPVSRIRQTPRQRQHLRIDNTSNHSQQLTFSRIFSLRVREKFTLCKGEALSTVADSYSPCALTDRASSVRTWLWNQLLQLDRRPRKQTRREWYRNDVHSCSASSMCMTSRRRHFRCSVDHKCCTCS